MNRTAKAIAGFAELCRLELPPEQLVAAALEALHEIVPSSRNLFDWCDDEGRLLHYYFEGAIEPSIAAAYFEVFHNRREAEAMPPFRALAEAPAGVRSARELDNARFIESALYHEIWKPQDLRYRLEAVVRGRRGQLLGSLVLYRGPRESCFSSTDEANLQHLLPHLSAALERTRVDPARVTEWTPVRDAPATLVVAGDGTPWAASEDALRLLMLAEGAISPHSLARAPDRIGRELLAELNRHAQAAGTHAPFVRDTVFGRFALRSHPLSPLSGSGARPGEPAAGLRAVTIERQEPRAVALEWALRQLALTPGQHRVCRALMQGWSQNQTAAALGIAPTTVADQLRKVYRELGVRSAAELASRLGIPPGTPCT